jgi:hypothetical protein
LFLSKSLVIDTKVCRAFLEKFLLQKPLVFLHEFLQLLFIKNRVRKPAVLALVTHACGVDPLAGKHLGFVAVVSVLLSSLTVVGHEVLA